jgi:hypothetical protein
VHHCCMPFALGGGTVARVGSPVTRTSGPVAICRGEIPGSSNLVPHISCQHPPTGGQRPGSFRNLTFVRCYVPFGARRLERLQLFGRRDTTSMPVLRIRDSLVPIRGMLITVGQHLVGIRRCLIGVSRRLIGIRVRLIGIRVRLIQVGGRLIGIPMPLILASARQPVTNQRNLVRPTIIAHQVSYPAADSGRRQTMRKRRSNQCSRRLGRNV